MNLGMSLNLSQEVCLEQRLEQKLSCRIETKIALKQYLEQEDFFKWLAKWVDDNNKWVDFNKGGFNFKYGLVPYNEVKHVADIYGPGFAHCFMEVTLETLLFGRIDKGTWTLYVVEGMVPKEFEEFVALHERGEELSLGNHFFASKLEFAGVRKARKTGNYIKWINENYPTKFVDLTELVLFPILPDELRAYLKRADSQHNKEIDVAKTLIEKYPLPKKLMEFVVKYDDINEKVESDLQDLLGASQYEINRAASLEDSVNRVNSKLSEAIKKIPDRELRVLVPRRIDHAFKSYFNFVNEFFYKAHNKHLNLASYDINELAKKVKAGEKIIGA